MDPYPHRYSVVASASVEGEVTLESNRLPALTSAAPAEFDGPGDRWSPETLCVSAVADCFVLTFRAIARASKLPWSSLLLERTEQSCLITNSLKGASRLEAKVATR